MKYYLSLLFIWVARGAYDVHIRLDDNSSWILDKEDNLWSYEEIGERIDEEILNEMEKKI